LRGSKAGVVARGGAGRGVGDLAGPVLDMMRAFFRPASPGDLGSMLRPVLHSKIHRATVTDANTAYVGSITIDPLLLRATGMRASDKVAVANCRNGERFETYILWGREGSGQIVVNGAAAHLVEVGDPVIIMHYGLMTDAEYASHKPRTALVDEKNRLTNVLTYDPMGHEAV
jgi:aspartate 1-decarboxylase